MAGAPFRAVGYESRHKCLFSVSNTGERYDYIEARKNIYLPLYIKLVKREPKFRELALGEGRNLLIIEIDGPHQESLSYYQEKYGVSSSFIKHGSIRANKKNLSIMLNDDKHPFGHGYCLAVALLGLTGEDLTLTT